MRPDQIRAVRNNNPGNIRIGAHWQGLMDPAKMNMAQQMEKSFCVFETPAWGFRAMAVIFTNYVKNHEAKNYGEAVRRWAPPSENNTASYIESVCDYCGASPNEPIPFPDGSIGAQATMLKAFSIHECGGWLFSMDDLYAGVRLAL